MPPMLANFKDVQGHKDKYLDIICTSRTYVPVERSCLKKCSCATWKLSYSLHVHVFRSYERYEI